MTCSDVIAEAAQNNDQRRDDETERMEPKSQFVLF